MSRNSNHIWVHLVWGVKNRNSLISDRTMGELVSFIKENFKENFFEIVISNGYHDHLHILIKPNLNDPINKIVKDIKGATSLPIYC